MSESFHRRDEGPSARAVWGGVAAVGLAQAFVDSLWAPHSTDLKLVAMWVGAWLRGAANVYTATMPPSDYPPNAIVELSPLALVPEAWLPPLWNGINVLLAPVLAVLALRACPRRTSRWALLVPALMFLSWGSVRVGIRTGQFSLAMVTLGLLAVAIVDRRPILGGVLLGLTLAKPHVGGAFFLWAVLSGRSRIAAIAGSVVVAGTAVFAFRIGEGFGPVVAGYLSVVLREFTTTPFKQGWVELRPLVHALLPHRVAAEAVHLGILLIVIAVAGRLSWRAIGLDRSHRDALVLRIACLVMLLSVFHNAYDLVLLAPVTMALWEARHASVQRLAIAYAVQLALVLDLPGLAVRVAAIAGALEPHRAAEMGIHLYRVLVLLLFVDLVRHGTASSGTPESQARVAAPAVAGVTARSGGVTRPDGRASPAPIDQQPE